MLAELPTTRGESKKNSETHEAVRDMRSLMKSLPLTKLAELGGSSPAVLCNWERGRAGLRPSQARLIHRIVRTEFAKFARYVAATAERHGASEQDSAAKKWKRVGREKCRTSMGGA
jgi:DNA-binding transcriptional regulator YiaG